MVVTVVAFADEPFELFEIDVQSMIAFDSFLPVVESTTVTVTGAARSVFVKSKMSTV